MDDKEIKPLSDWAESKKKDYIEILSGFRAERIWYDQPVEEGSHSVFFSILTNPSKNQYKTFKQRFSVKSGTSNYLYLTVSQDGKGGAEIQVRHIIDPENRRVPF